MSEIKELLKAIQLGVGFAGCHGSTGDSFRTNTQYQYMVGRQFVSHLGGQINYMVYRMDKPYFITDGMEDCSAHTKQYYTHVYPNNTVLASTVFTSDAHTWIQGAIMPIIWIKHYGKGRVFYSSLGHALKDILHPQSWETLPSLIYGY